MEMPIPPRVSSHHSGRSPVEVESTNPLTGLPGRLVKAISGHDPSDLELQAIGVLAVKTFGGAVIRRTSRAPFSARELANCCISARVSISHARW
jgi:hypothetical protein